MPRPFSPVEDAELVRRVLAHPSFDATVSTSNSVFEDVMAGLLNLPRPNAAQESLRGRRVSGIRQRFNHHLGVIRKSRQKLETDYLGGDPNAQPVEEAPAAAPEHEAQVAPERAIPAADEQRVVAGNLSLLEQFSNLFNIEDRSRTEERVLGVANRLGVVIRDLGQLPEEEANQRANNFLIAINGALDTVELINQMAAVNLATPEAENEEH